MNDSDYLVDLENDDISQYENIINYIKLILDKSVDLNLSLETNEGVVQYYWHHFMNELYSDRKILNFSDIKVDYINVGFVFMWQDIKGKVYTEVRFL